MGQNFPSHLLPIAVGSVWDGGLYSVLSDWRELGASWLASSAAWTVKKYIVLMNSHVDSKLVIHIQMTRTVGTWMVRPRRGTTSGQQQSDRSTLQTFLTFAPAGCDMCLMTKQHNLVQCINILYDFQHSQNFACTQDCTTCVISGE